MRIALFLSFISSALGVFAQDAVVSQEGEGDFRTIGEALKKAPDQATKPYVIRLRKGVYREKVFIDKPFITLEGDSRETTQIVYPILWRAWEKEFKTSKENADIRWGCATVNLSPRANDCTLNSLTIYNNYGSTIENTFESNVPSVLGRYHKEHCFYLINCVFKAKIKDVPIQYAYADKKPVLRWGERIYFLKCRNLEGTPFSWTRDNSPVPAEKSTANWTFDGRWDPEQRQ